MHGVGNRACAEFEGSVEDRSHKDVKIMVLGIGLVRILRVQYFGYIS